MDIDYYLNYDFSFLNKYKNLSYILIPKYNKLISNILYNNYYIYLSNILTYNNIYKIYKYKGININYQDKIIDSNTFQINYNSSIEYYYKIYYDLNKLIYIGKQIQIYIIKKIILNKNIILDINNNFLFSKYYKNINMTIYYQKKYKNNVYKIYFKYNNMIKINSYYNYKKIFYKDSEYSYNIIKDIYTINNNYNIYYKICNNYYIERDYDFEYITEDKYKYYIKNKILTNYKLFFII